VTTNNHLTLAVAGSRKTQGIVDSCAAADRTERLLVLTYTTSNQSELRNRIAALAGDHPRIEVSGWFSFLIGNFVRPFLPFLYRGQSVRGFDFKSPPQQYARVEDWSRYFNADGHVRKVHLPQLATRLEEASQGAGIRRLERVYSRIFIDEVQDLCGYDLEMLTLLMRSRIPLEMVGDVRQAILATNDRERKNKPYMFMRIWNWFRAEEKAGRLVVSHRCETWRCHPAIAGLADSLFGDEWGFETTISLNSTTTGHDGIFLVRPEHVDAYVATYAPLALRHSANSGRNLDHLTLMNIGEAKGLGRERVLIVPTEPMKQFVGKGTPLEHQQAARFYVAITRAEQSVAIVLDRPGRATYPYWTPPP
jgi:hypothetical protein